MFLLVTGGAGFIGSNLVRLAMDRGHDVRVIDDFSTGYRTNLEGLDIDVREASILDESALASAMHGVEAVVHLAALGSVPRSITDPARTHLVNATGTLRVLEAARASDVGHVSCASSSSVYGLNPELPKNERAWVRPLSPYAVSKLATEQYTLAYQQSFGMTTLAFRFFNVYGPRQMPGHAYAAVVPIFLSSLLAGQPLPIHGDGNQSRDFTNVRTVCDVLLRAAVGRVTHAEPVNLAFGTNTTIRELVNVMESITGRPAELAFQPPRAGDVRASQADNARLMELFADLVPVELQQGIGETAEWMVTL